MNPHAFYCTTYCNFAHRIATGRPIGHECAILPPAAIKAEMVGDYERAIAAIEAAKPLRFVKGQNRP